MRKLKKSMEIVCSLLIMLAPAIISNTSCALLWGEPKCPDILKVNK